MSRIRFPLGVALFFGIPAATVGAGYLYLQYKINRYPLSTHKILRKALLAHDHGYGNLSDVPGQYQQVIQETLAANTSKSSAEITGLYERLADVYRKLNQPNMELKTLEYTFNFLRDVKAPIEKNWFTGDDVSMQRAFRVAFRLAELNLELNQKEKSRSYFEWMMSKGIIGRDIASRIKLHPSATVNQMGVAMDSLASIYSTHRLHEHAISVYFGALDLLDRDDSVSATDRDCLSALIHNNIASCFLSIHESNQSKENRSSLEKALRFSRIATEMSLRHEQNPTCQQCRVSSLVNIGLCKAAYGNRNLGIRSIESALHLAAKIGFEEGSLHAKSARETLTNITPAN